MPRIPSLTWGRPVPCTPGSGDATYPPLAPSLYKGGCSFERLQNIGKGNGTSTKAHGQSCK